MTDATSDSTALVETPAAKGIIAGMAMVSRGPTGGVVLRPETYAEVIAVAQMMAQASHAVPKHLRGNPGACMAVVLRASNWDMDPFAVATKTYMVNDILAYESQLVSAVVNMRAPVKGRPKIVYEGDGPELRCTFSYTMLDGDVLEYRSPKVKDIKVKNSPLWVGDPEQQLFYFAARAWARRWVPEVLMGVYTPDEVIDQVSEDGMRATSFEALEARAAGIAEPVIEDAVIEDRSAQTDAKGPVARPQPPAAQTRAQAADEMMHRNLADGFPQHGEHYCLMRDTPTTDGYIASYIDGVAQDNVLMSEKLLTYAGHAELVNADARPQSAKAAENPGPAAVAASSASDAGTETDAGAPGSGSTTTTASEASAAESGEHGAADAGDSPQEHQIEESLTPREVDRAVDGTPQPAVVPPEFTAFADVVASAKTWEPIREALPALRRSDAWRDADPEMPLRLHRMAFTRLMQMLHEGYRFDFTEDLHAYRCYLDYETDLKTLQLHRGIVLKTKMWMEQPTDTKVVFDRAYAAAEARIKAGAQPAPAEYA